MLFRSVVRPDVCYMYVNCMLTVCYANCMPCCEVFAVDGDGYMRLPAAPGLGVDIDEAKARATIRVHMWSGS